MAENQSAGANCLQGSELPGAPGKPQHAPGDALSCLPLDRIREELTCCVCIELAVRPATLPCGHNACRRCLEALFASAPQNERCPSCRAPVPAAMPSLEINASLKNLAEMLWPDECRERSQSPSPELQWRGSQRVHALSRAIPARDSLAHETISLLWLHAALAAHDIADSPRRLANHAIRTPLAPADRLTDTFSPAVPAVPPPLSTTPTAAPAGLPAGGLPLRSLLGAAPAGIAPGWATAAAQGRQPSSLAEMHASPARRTAPFSSRRHPMQGAGVAAPEAAGASASTSGAANRAASEAASPAPSPARASRALPSGAEENLYPAMHSRLQLAEERLTCLRAEAAARRQAAGVTSPL